MSSVASIRGARLSVVRRFVGHAWLKTSAVVVSLTMVGCSRPDAATIAGWKSHPEAATKLSAVVKDADLPAALRGQAAGALVEVGFGEDMEAAVAGLDVDQRAALIPATVPVLAPLLKSPDGEKSGDARDALYALRAQSTTTEARKAIEAVLYPALVEDLRAGRQRAGRYELSDMLIGIGKPVVPLLMPLLEDPAVPFGPAVDVLEKIGDVAIRNQGGDALVTRAKKQTSIPETLWPALARLGGKQAAAFMMAAVDRETPPDADRAAQALLKIAPRTEGVSAYAVTKAGDPATPAPRREEMFQIAERDGSDAAKKPLLALIGTTKDSAIRLRAYQALVKATEGAAINDGLEAFPARAPLTVADLEEKIVAPLAAMPGMNTRGPLFKGLQSASPLAKLVAIRALEKMGFKSDADVLMKLEKDRGTVAGLPATHRVGLQAQRAAAALRKGGF